MNIIRIGVAPWGSMKPKCFQRYDQNCRPGVELEILETLVRSLSYNVSVKITEVNDRGCGTQMNGNWTGLSALLFNNKIDIIGNLCDLDEERQKNFGFSFPVWQYPQAYLMRAPEPSYRFNPSAPFHLEVWLSFLTCILIWYMVMLSRHLVILRMNLKKSMLQCGADMVNFSLGFLDPKDGKYYWLIWICFFGFMLIVYDTYIKTALLYSYTISRPFKDATEFAESMLRGTHILLDTRNPAKEPPCVNAYTCSTFKKAIDMGNYRYSKTSEGKELVKLLADDEKLVLPKGKIFLETYINDHPKRKIFWLFEDDTISGMRSVFLWRKDLPYRKQFDRVLEMMGDYKFNIRSRYTLQKYAEQPQTDDVIKSTILDEEALSIERLRGPFYLYFFMTSLSLFAFVLELIQCLPCYTRVH